MGGLIRSEDDGRTWQDRTGDMNRDIHCVAAHPSAPAVLYTSTPHGPYRSDNGGQKWTPPPRGRPPPHPAPGAVPPSPPPTPLPPPPPALPRGRAARFRAPPPRGARA